MSIMRKCLDRSAQPAFGVRCIVLTDDPEVPLRTAYWCNGSWRDPHTAQRLVPLVLSWCLMSEAVSLLESAGSETLQALDGLKNQGTITAEQAEHARRRIAEGGEA